MELHLPDRHWTSGSSKAFLKTIIIAAVQFGAIKVAEITHCTFKCQFILYVNECLFPNNGDNYAIKVSGPICFW